jgi:hypothetical protein
MLLVFYRSRKDSAPAGAILATCAPEIRQQSFFIENSMNWAKSARFLARIAPAIS